MVKPKSKMLLVVALISIAVGLYAKWKQRQMQAATPDEGSTPSPIGLEALAKSLLGNRNQQQVQSGGGGTTTTVQAAIDLGPVVKLIGDGVKALGKGIGYVAKGIGAGFASLFGFGGATRGTGEAVSSKAAVAARNGELFGSTATAASNGDTYTIDTAFYEASGGTPPWNTFAIPSFGTSDYLDAPGISEPVLPSPTYELPGGLDSIGSPYEGQV